MFGRKKVAFTLSDIDDFDKLSQATEDYKFDANKHDKETKREITKLFLNWYFWLIILSFIFCLAYNWIVALLNVNLNALKIELIPYIEVSNTVSLITTTLSSGVGFVIGYYFKNKERD